MGHAGTDYVLVARATASERPYAELLGDLEGALRQLGFSIGDARIGRVVDLQLDETDPAAAQVAVERMCEQLLANPLIEGYEIELPEQPA